MISSNHYVCHCAPETDPIKNSSAGQVHGYQLAIVQTHVSHASSGCHGSGGAAEIHLVADTGVRRVGDVHDGETGGAIRHGDNVAGHGHALGVTGSIHLGDADRTKGSSHVEDGDAGSAIGEDDEIIERAHVHGGSGRGCGGQYAGARSQVAQWVQPLRHLRTVRDAIAVGVGVVGVGANDELGTIRKAIRVTIRPGVRCHGDIRKLSRAAIVRTPEDDSPDRKGDRIKKGQFVNHTGPEYARESS